MEAQEEVDALASVAAALEPLDEDARRRILDWVHARYLAPGYDMLTKERRDAAVALMDASNAMYALSQAPHFKGITVNDVVRGMGELKRLSLEAAEREKVPA